MLDGRQDQSHCCRACGCDNQGGFGVGLCLSANPCGMQIMAGLNLLRFLLLKGPKDLERTVQRNETGVGNSDIPATCASVCSCLGWRKTLSLFDVVVCEATAFPRVPNAHVHLFLFIFSFFRPPACQQPPCSYASILMYISRLALVDACFVRAGMHACMHIDVAHTCPRNHGGTVPAAAGPDSPAHRGGVPGTHCHTAVRMCIQCVWGRRCLAEVPGA